MDVVSEKSFAQLDIEGRIQAVTDALLKQDPMLPQHLAQIHKALIEHEELVHLLSDDKIREIVAGQKKHVSVSLIQEITRKKPSTAKTPKASADDF